MEIPKGKILYEERTLYSKRKIIILEAELILGYMSCAVFIVSLSEDGIFIITSPTKTAVWFTPGTTLELKFQLPSRDKLNLSCKVIWSYKTHPQGLANNVGMEIIDPPLRYREFFKTL